MKTQTQAPKMGNIEKKVLIVKPTVEMKKEPTTEAKKEDVKPPVMQVLLKEKTEELKEVIKSFAPSAEERIKNADNFKILTNKFAHLKTKSDELKRFKISSDGMKEKIYLENAEGFKFEVSNSKIIDETLNLLETTLNKILSDTEEQVKNFII